MITGQTWAGIVGVPRRTQSASYGGDLPAGWDASMNLNAVGAAVAAPAGALFVVIMVMTLLAGKKTDVAHELVPSGTR